MKLFYSQQDYFFKKLQIVVDLCKCSEQVELVRVADDGELRALAPQATGFLLETPEGYITRSTAIMRALALMFPTSQLYGMGLFSDAKVCSRFSPHPFTFSFPIPLRFRPRYDALPGLPPPFPSTH